MSTTIENRVVQMQFDNKSFEKNVKETLKSLQNLKENLDLEKAVSHLENIDKAFAAIPFTKIAESVDSIAERFTFLGSIAYKALDQITDKILDVGKSFASQLTGGAISSGMSKYEQQIKAMQVLMNSTGMSMQELDPYIQDLMKYSDDTSYSFEYMLDTLYKFVNAGKSMQESVDMVKGLGNAAAMAGVGMQETNRVFYNMAQAVGSGSLKLLDWKSISDAGMATQEVQKQLIEVAKHVGTINKQGKVAIQGQKKMLVNTQTFTSTLSTGWLNDQVMLKWAQEYAGTSSELFEGLHEKAFKAAKETKTFTDLWEYLKDAVSSGWMDTFKNVIGDEVEATAMWSAVAEELGEVFGNISEARNELLSKWKKFGGRTFLLDGLKAYYEGLKEIFTAISEGWKEVFPDLKWTDLRKATDAFRDYALKFKSYFSDETEEGSKRLDNFAKIGSGVASIISIVTKLLKPLGEIFGKVFVDLFDPALNALGDFGAYLFELNLALDNNEFLQTLVDGFLVLADVFIDILPGAFGAVKDLLFGIYKWLDDNGVIQDAAKAWLSLTTGFATRLPKVIAMMKDFGEGVKAAFNEDAPLGQFLAKVKQRLKPLLDWFQGFFEVFKACFDQFLDMDTSGENSLGEKLKKRFSAFQPLLDYVTGTFKEKYEKFLADHPKIAAFIEKLKVVFDWIKQKLGVVNMESLKAKGTSAIASMKEYFGQLKEFFSNLLTDNIFTRGFDSFKEWISQFGLEEIKESAINFGQRILEKVYGFIDYMKEHFTLQEIAGFLKTIASIGQAFALVGMIRNISKFFKSFSGVGESISETIESFKKGGAEQNFTQKFLNIAAGIGIIVASMYVLTKMSASDIDRAKETLLQIGLALAGLTFIMSRFNGKGSGGIKDIGIGLLASAAGLFVFYKVLTKLMELDPADAAKGLGILGALFLELGIFMRLAGKNAFTKNNKFTQLAVALNLMMIPILILGNMDNKSLAKGIISLGILMTMVGVLAKTTNGVGAGGGFVALSIALNLLLIPITILGSMRTKSLIKGVGAIVILVGTMALAAKVTSGAKMGALLGFAVILGLIMVAFGAALKFTKDIEMDKMIAFAGSLSIMILAMTASIALLGNMGATAGFTAALNMLELLGLLGIAMLGVGLIFNKFDKDGGLMEALDMGIAVFEKIGQGLGRIVGGIITGIFGQAIMPMDDLIKLGGSVKTFSENVDGLQLSPVQTCVDAIKLLGEAAASVPRVGGLVGALLGDHDVAGFAKDLPDLGTGIASFSDSVKNVKADHVSAVASSMKVVAELTDMVPKTGGFFNWVAEGLFGVKDYGQFKADMVSIGEAIVAFADTTKGVNAKSIESVTNAATGIVALTDIVPKEGGFFNWVAEGLFGVKNYDQFTTDLVTLGQGIADFATTVKDVNANTIEKVSNAALALTALNDNVPPTGGKLQEWFGVKDLGNFGESLKPLGEGISNFADSVKGVDNDSITKAGNSAQVLATLAREIPATGGVLQDWLGTKDLSKFGENLPALGSSLAEFATAVQGLDTDSIDKAKGAADGLAALANAIPADGGWFQQIFGKQDLAEFGGQLGALGSGLNEFAVKSNGVNESDLSAATQVLKDLSALGIDINQFNNNYDIQAFGIKLEGLGEKLLAFSNKCMGVNIPITSAAVQMVATLSRLAKEFDGVRLTDGVENLKRVFGSLATDSNGIGTSAAAIAGDFLAGFGSQFQNGSEPVKDLLSICGDFVQTVVSDMKTEENYDRWNKLGRYFVQGFAAGIKENVGMAKDAGTLPVAAAETGLRERGDIHSPSRVAMELGNYFTEGFIIGIGNLTNKVKEASGNMGDAAIQSAKSSLADFSSMLAEDIDPDPTIRPVLDLSDIIEGVGELDDMFNDRQMAAFGAMTSSMMARDVRGTTSSDYSELINSINNKIDELNESITNMQVVLDSGALVGQISGQMDASLGTIATYKGRGN